LGLRSVRRGRLWWFAPRIPRRIRQSWQARCRDSWDVLAGHCRGLPGAELTSLDRVLERKLWEIDRADVHAVTGGSDDGFLYSRGFTVAMGREFYGSVMDTPQMAVPWAECEEMCYFFAQLYREWFGDFPDTGSGISRESGSNLVGWAR
jgi:Protein of unknown function (DUF4240)